MKRLKKKNNPLWDRLLIEKLKTNKMKTCKDCDYYNKGDNGHVTIDTFDVKIRCGCNDHCISKDKFKPKKMKRNKQEIKFIKEAYNSNDICSDWKTKIKETFPDIKFERELPETWEEYCEIVGMEIKDIRFCQVETIKSTRETPVYHEVMYYGYTLLDDKYIALYKLELLRDHYNDGYNFKHGENKHVIWYDDNGDTSIDTWKGHEFLRFKTEKLAIQFLKNFKDLIEQAGDLI